jgi:hypothetical protein
MNNLTGSGGDTYCFFLKICSLFLYVPEFIWKGKWMAQNEVKPFRNIRRISYNELTEERKKRRSATV